MVGLKAVASKPQHVLSWPQIEKFCFDQYACITYKHAVRFASTACQITRIKSSSSFFRAAASPFVNFTMFIPSSSVLHECDLESMLSAKQRSAAEGFREQAMLSKSARARGLHAQICATQTHTFQVCAGLRVNAPVCANMRALCAPDFFLRFHELQFLANKLPCKPKSVRGFPHIQALLNDSGPHEPPSAC